MFTLDFEDWYHVLDTELNDNSSLWPSQGSILEDATDVLLEILETHNVKITFFVVSGLVSQHGKILERILSAGHEVASHTHSHKSFAKLNMDEIAHELETSKAELEGNFGITVTGFRAPGFSIDESRIAGFYDLLRTTGYSYDSSWFNGRRLTGGISKDQKRKPFHQSGVKIFPINGPWPMGGAYMRLMPQFLWESLLSTNGYNMIYVHPRDYHDHSYRRDAKYSVRLDYGVKTAQKKLIYALRSYSNRDLRLNRHL